MATIKTLAAPQTAMVRIVGLQVVLAKQGKDWIAQGIELDYVAAGTSQGDVKKRFEDGLTETIQAHLDKFGHLKNLVASTPAEVWMDLLKSNPKSQTYTSVSIHTFTPPVSDFPFGSIRYLVPEDIPQDAEVH
jgi:hypothetical protein